MYVILWAVSFARLSMRKFFMLASGLSVCLIYVQSDWMFVVSNQTGLSSCLSTVIKVRFKSLCPEPKTFKTFRILKLNTPFMLCSKRFDKENLNMNKDVQNSKS